jgi:hypothetical protein
MPEGVTGTIEEEEEILLQSELFSLCKVRFLSVPVSETPLQNLIFMCLSQWGSNKISCFSNFSIYIKNTFI